MCDGAPSGSSGQRGQFVAYETRQIVIAQGVEGHESDCQTNEQWRQRMIRELETDRTAWRNDDACVRMYTTGHMGRLHKSDQQIGDILLARMRNWEGLYDNVMQRLQRELGAANVTLTDNNMRARYVSNAQRVIYEIRIVQRRSEYKTALQDQELIVIYSGHSRYGRGAVFAQYNGAAPAHGEFWGSGTAANLDEGIYRLGYPFVAVPFSDIEHHQYTFTPMPVEGEALPGRVMRHPWNFHPECSGWRRRITLPEALRQHVPFDRQSQTNRYWGVRRQGEDHLFLLAGWQNAEANGMDLGATDLRCRTFCHFGCSSQLHYWNIVRRREYKGYQRNNPPTQGLAYFTTAPSNKKSLYWLVYLLSYDQPNNSPRHFFESHEYAKRTANARLRTERAGFLIY